MPKRLINSLIAALIFCGISCAEEIRMQELVAHGGGKIGNITSTNSLEALDYNYNKGFRFFEIDFNWTLDEELVLIHDWEECLERLYKTGPKLCSLGEFTGLEMVNGMTQMKLGDLINWMLRHPDIYIITDIKSDNIKGLRKISKEYPAFKHSFIPQIYTYEEYDKAKEMGFEDMILTLYRSNYPDEDVVNFLSTHKVSALTMWHYRANKDFIDRLKKLGIFIYAHTVNDPKLKTQLKDMGVDGFYTDSLEPAGK